MSDNNYTKLAEDLNKYLNDKLPDISASTSMEIGTYLSNRISIFITDHTNDLFNQWERWLYKIPAPRRHSAENNKDLTQCKDCVYWHHSGYCNLIGMSITRVSSDFCSRAVKKGE